MRYTFLFAGLMLLMPAMAQQITNVTATPSPLHACVPVTFNISGTSAGGLAVDFVESMFGEDHISLTLTVTTGPGNAPYTKTLGPYAALGEGTYGLTFKLKRNGQITSTWTGSLNVLAPQLPDMGEPNSITVCPNDAPFPLLSQLGGTPASGGFWVDPAMVTVPNGIFVPGVNLDGQYYYFIDMPEPCEMQFQVLDIVTLPNNSAGKDSTISLCTLPGGSPVELFPYLGGNPDQGGTWSGPGGNNTGVFTPGVTPPGNYVYQVAGIAPCSDPTATITVQAAPENNAGTGGEAEFCFDETSAHLAPYLTGAQTTGFWMEPTGYAIAYYNDPIDVSVYGAGIYRYVVETSACPGDTAMVTVVLNGPPCTLGVNGPDGGSDQLQLMPNPATGQVWVEGRLERPWKGLTLVVSDVEGRVVLQHALPEVSVLREAVDLSTLAPGTYLVQMTGGPKVPVQRLLVH